MDTLVNSEYPEAMSELSSASVEPRTVHQPRGGNVLQGAEHLLLLGLSLRSLREQFCTHVY